MATLYITAIGYTGKNAVEDVFELMGLKGVNPINLIELTRLTKIGNFRVFRYSIELEDDDVVKTRRTLAKKLSEEVTVLENYEDPMRMYAIKKLRV